MSELTKRLRTIKNTEDYCKDIMEAYGSLPKGLLYADIHRAADRIEALERTAIHVTASLVAAVSLLERGGKKAAASDKMFAQMLVDYNKVIDKAREVLKDGENE